MITYILSSFYGIEILQNMLCIVTIISNKKMSVQDMLCFANSKIFYTVKVTEYYIYTRWLLRYRNFAEHTLHCHYYK